MLVLSRQIDGVLMIGDDIEVTVVDIRGDKVRLGITAPKEIAVHRKEVYEAIKRENRAAAQVKAPDETIAVAPSRGTEANVEPLSQVETGNVFAGLSKVAQALTARVDRSEGETGYVGPTRVHSRRLQEERQPLRGSRRRGLHGPS